MPIEFYRERDLPYGCFSNFSKHGFGIDGTHWPTVEHFFQAMKFAAASDQDAVRLAPDPMTAKNRGNERSRPLRPDWDAIKDDVMRRAVRAKFEQNDDIRAVLLGTGDEELVEAALNDSYWGSGKDGAGRNQLGKTLMEVRDALR